MRRSSIKWIESKPIQVNSLTGNSVLDRLATKFGATLDREHGSLAVVFLCNSAAAKNSGLIHFWAQSFQYQVEALNGATAMMRFVALQKRRSR